MPPRTVKALKTPEAIQTEKVTLFMQYKLATRLAETRFQMMAITMVKTIRLLMPIRCKWVYIWVMLSAK